MCGIAGIYGTGDVRAMTARLVHRGPELTGIAQDDAKIEPRFRHCRRQNSHAPVSLARLGELRALITGYDVSAGRARTLLQEYAELRASQPRDR